MQYRQLGRSGLRVSALSLGTNSFGGRADRDTASKIVNYALDHGINLIDTADVYHHGTSEAIIGEAIAGRRDEVFLATKVGIRPGERPDDADCSRAHIHRQLEASLRNLGTDTIDLYQIHRFDPSTPLEQTLRTLDDLVSQGMVRYIGCSNYAAWQVCRALWLSDREGYVPFDVVQQGYSLADRSIEKELLPLCREMDLGTLIFWPLASGLLTGKYRLGEDPPEGSRGAIQPGMRRMVLTERNLKLAEEVVAVAEEVGVTPAQLSLAWLLHQPGVTSAIVGATSVDQVEENLQAAELELSDSVLERLDAVSDPDS